MFLLLLVVVAGDCGPSYPVKKVDNGIRALEKLKTPGLGTMDLRRCMTLLPAGTGTESLTEAFKSQFNATLSNWAHSHDHRVDPKVPCYVMTLRDPAARFESGWRHPTRAPTTRKSLKTNDVNLFVETFRKNTKDQRLRHWYLDNVRYNKRHHQYGWFRFWTAQIDYLTGFLASRHRVAFICLESFADDFANLLSKQQHHHHGSSVVTVPHTHDRSGGTGDDRNLSTLSPENAIFLRSCLYPWDTRLHARVCGKRHHRWDESSSVVAQ